MKEYGRIGQKILDMKMSIEELNKATLKFKDYQKAKRELEFERHKSVANYKGPSPNANRKSGSLTMIEEEEQEKAPNKTLDAKKDD